MTEWQIRAQIIRLEKNATTARIRGEQSQAEDSISKADRYRLQLAELLNQSPSTRVL